MTANSMEKNGKAYIPLVAGTMLHYVVGKALSPQTVPITVCRVPNLLHHLPGSSTINLPLTDQLAFSTAFTIYLVGALCNREVYGLFYYRNLWTIIRTSCMTDIFIVKRIIVVASCLVSLVHTLQL